MLAIACKQAGLAVRLYERDDHCQTPQALLELTANGTRVLHALGLKRVLSDAALMPEFRTLRSAGSGFLLSQLPLGAFSEARYGAPCYLIEAQALKELLWHACAQHQIAIQRAADVLDVETSSATITMRDGSRFQHLAVAIASGWSVDDPLSADQTETPVLANLLESRSWSQTTTTVIRARAKRTRPSRDHDRFINTWLLSGGYCTERPVAAIGGGEQQVELVAVATFQPINSTAQGAIEELLGRAHPMLSSLTTQLTDAEHLLARSAEPARFWHAGRTVLLGATAHAPAAYAEFGPSVAMEDAWILSRMIERWEEEPHQDFAEYARFRQPRARRLHAFTRSEFDARSESRPGHIWRRNLRWALTSRFLPEIAMQRLDWLYGYDCIKGFA